MENEENEENMGNESKEKQNTSFDIEIPGITGEFSVLQKIEKNEIITETSESSQATNDANDEAIDDTPEAKEEKVRKKKVPVTEEELRQCKYCDYKAKDWPAYVGHVFKKSHVKKVAEAYKLKLAESDYVCNVCMITCKGHQQFNEHMNGAKHRKILVSRIAAEKVDKNDKGGGPIKNSQLDNVQKKKPYDKIQEPAKNQNVPAIGAKVFATYPQPLIGLEYVTEIQVGEQNPRYECSLCDSKFEHDLKFPHLVGQKHRMNVLRIKRPDFVKELHPKSKKRSELSALLLRQSIELELEEGRKEVRTRVEKPASGSSTIQEGNRAGAKRGGKGKASHPHSGIRAKRGKSYPRGESRVDPRGTFSESCRSFSSYGPYDQDDFGYDSYSYRSFDSESYNMPYDATRGNERNFQQSSGFGLAFPEQRQPYPGQPPQIPFPRSLSPSPKKGISSDLASALGDLTKLVQDPNNQSIAVQVSNALTQALMQCRKDDDGFAG